MRCWPSVARKGRPPSLTSPTDCEQVPSKRRRRTRSTPLPGIMENAIDLTPNAWHLRDAPDPEGTTVWTVYEMALFRRGLGIAHILVDVTPAGRAWRAHMCSWRSISPWCRCSTSLSGYPLSLLSRLMRFSRIPKNCCAHGGRRDGQSIPSPPSQMNDMEMMGPLSRNLTIKQTTHS